MAQLRQDYDAISARGAEVVVIGPEDRDAFTRHWDNEALPFVGLADPDHTVANAYGQEVKLLKMGRLPASVVIDRSGVIRYRHYGDSMLDFANSDHVLAVLDEITADGAADRLVAA